MLTWLTHGHNEGGAQKKEKDMAQTWMRRKQNAIRKKEKKRKRNFFAPNKTLHNQ